jgi:CMP/dCMP kinase
VKPREPVITIDGPAGAGKSTAAHGLARRLGYRRLDTGAMYRAVAVSVAAAGIPPDDLAALERHLERLTLDLDGNRIFVNGRDVTGEIRDEAVSRLTSALSAVGAVRAAVIPLQRRLAAGGGIVLEGRDTGTVVCPEADVKFYLDATLDTRARRRHAELVRAGTPIALDAVRVEMAARDAQDMARSLAPLAKAADAIEVDTTALSAEEVVDRMLEWVEQRRCCTKP